MSPWEVGEDVRRVQNETILWMLMCEQKANIQLKGSDSGDTASFNPISSRAFALPQPPQPALGLNSKIHQGPFRSRPRFTPPLEKSEEEVRESSEEEIA